MSAPHLDVLPALYTTVTSVAEIVSDVGVYNSVPSIHTRRPVPEDATYPLIAIGPIVTRNDTDGINDYKPLLIIDVSVYGEQPAHYRVVEELAEKIYGLFHRRPRAVALEGYTVTSLTCSGPSPAPVDDTVRVGRRVTLTISMYAT